MPNRPLGRVMPTPGLCGVDLLAYPMHGGSRILAAELVGMITSSPGKRLGVRRSEAGRYEPGWAWRAPVRVLWVACQRAEALVTVRFFAACSQRNRRREAV
jgi:hypothetical protein